MVTGELKQLLLQINTSWSAVAVRIKALSLSIVLLAFTAGMAQDAPTPISPDNVRQLSLVRTIGSALPQQLSFSPNDDYLIASTSEQSHIYQTDDLEAPPTQLPFTEFVFEDEELVADGQYWNLATGLSNGVAPAVRIVPGVEDQINTIVQVLLPGGEVIEVDTGFYYNVLGTAVTNDYSTLWEAQVEVA